jgi:hypothetical protein
MSMRVERLSSSIALAAAAVMLGALAWPLAVGKVFQQDDLGLFHLPVRQFYAQCLAAGDDPRWMPGLYCGFDLHGEGQAGLDHPLHRLLYGTLPLAAAFQLEVWLNYPALFLGTALLLGRLGLRRDASLLGALLFTFAGFNIIHYVHVNAMAVIAHVPWLLLGIHTALRSVDPRRAGRAAVGVAVLTASQWLLGYPQYVAFSVVVEGLFATWVGARDGRSWVRLAAAKWLGTLVGCDQLLPTLGALAASARSRPGGDGPVTGSLHPLNLLQFVAPYAFAFRHYEPGGHPSWPMHEQAVYAGAAVPALVVWWISCKVSQPGAARRDPRGPLLFAAIALLLALGSFTPIYPLAAQLPLVGFFRVPSRYVFFAHALTALVAAMAYDGLARWSRPGRRIWPLLLVPLASLLAGFGLWMLPRPDVSAQLAPLRGVLAGTIAVGLPALVVGLAARGRRWSLVALVALVALDQVQHGLEMIVRRDVPQSIPSSAIKTSHRVKADSNRLVLSGYRLVDGYIGLHPLRRLDYNRAASLEVACAGPAPCPRVRLVGHAVASRDPRTDIERIDRATTALVETPLSLPPGPQGTATVLSDRPGAILMTTNALVPRLLVVSESYHPGWRATIDGRPATLLRTNGDFLGCVVGPGRREVRLRFDPASHRLGRALAIAGVVLMAAWWVRCGKRQTGGFRMPAALRARPARAAGPLLPVHA